MDDDVRTILDCHSAELASVIIGQLAIRQKIEKMGAEQARQGAELSEVKSDIKRLLRHFKL